ncbi:MAG: hypothetical protein JO098_08105, partial [Candidatus Eremiobacteraeota bacterium]|nr:hypothetical protein [Candidatus Eremiobacteraeota bacterium]
MNKIALPAFAAGILTLCLWSLTCAAAQAATTWPVTTNVNGITVTFYEPQATDWQDYKELYARVAVSAQQPGKAPMYGVVNLKADTVADAEGGTVVVSNVQVVSTSFPSLTADQQKSADTWIRSKATELGSRVVPLNTIVLSLKGADQASQQQVNL